MHHPAGANPAWRAAVLSGIALGMLQTTEAQANGGADELDALEQRIEQLKRELEALRREQAEQRERIEEQERELDTQRARTEELPKPEETVTAGDEPGSFKMPGTDTSVKIGGYVKADLIYDIGPENGDTFAASAIPAEGSEADRRKGAFRAHARQTRINLTTWTPTEIGDVKTFIEGDFFGGGGNEGFSNSTSFRIRHAFGEVGPFMAGQYWTLFMPLASYPATVDFFGPAGIPFIRQGQLRFTHEVDDNWTVAVSAENSELSGRAYTSETVGSDGGDLRFAIDTLPDFIGAIDYAHGGFSAKVSGLARLLETTDARSDSSEFGWGVHASAVVPTFADDSIQLNFTYGDGVGRYIINGFGQDAFVEADGSLETVESWGLVAAYTRHWTDKWRSNFVYGHYEVEDTFFDTDTESLDTAHVNLMWSPTDNTNFGLEYIFGHRGFDDGDLDNEAHRVQFGAQYFF